MTALAGAFEGPFSAALSHRSAGGVCGAADEASVAGEEATGLAAEAPASDGSEPALESSESASRAAMPTTTAAAMIRTMLPTHFRAVGFAAMPLTMRRSRRVCLAGATVVA